MILRSKFRYYRERLGGKVGPGWLWGHWWRGYVGVGEGRKEGEMGEEAK